VNAEKFVSARITGDRDRQERLVLTIRGKGQHAQRLLEAEVLNEQQRPTMYTAEHGA
jgi:hypothetical protein